MRRNYPPSRFSAKPGPKLNRDRQYEQFKEMWRVRHPNATPREYELAMQEIARKLGI